MMNQQDQSFSFPQAIAFSQDLMKKMQQQQLSETAIQKAIANLVATQTGARGFFVAYLTGEIPVADQPTEGVIKALQASPEIVSDLLVKNVAMSAAMSLTHLRNQDETAAAGSQKVMLRTVNLIKLVQMPEIEQQLDNLESTIVKGTGIYQDFLARWNYDQQQQEKIQEAINLVKNK